MIRAYLWFWLGCVASEIIRYCDWNIGMFRLYQACMHRSLLAQGNGRGPWERVEEEKT